MKYLFILGRNPELSIAELRAYFNLGEKKLIQEANAVLIELEKLDKKEIDRLGGVIAIGEVMASVENIEEIDKKEIYFGSKNNFSYVIYDFSKFTDDVRDYLKQRFRSEKFKASEKNLHQLKLIEGEIGFFASGLLEEEYFVFGEYFGRIIQKCDYEELEKRDMNKPVRRESLAISPRLAKMMINISGIKKGKILDPFCGIGVILQEALLLDQKVIGIDKDKDAIEGAKQNLVWGKFNKENYKLINEDSRKINLNERVDAIVTEPDLGFVLKRIPSENEAISQLRNFEELIISVINNLKKNVSGKIVFSAPLIKTEKGRISCNKEKIENRAGLKIKKNFPIKEFREEQIVGREIFCLEKN